MTLKFRRSILSEKPKPFVVFRVAEPDAQTRVNISCPPRSPKTFNKTQQHLHRRKKKENLPTRCKPRKNILSKYPFHLSLYFVFRIIKNSVIDKVKSEHRENLFTLSQRPSRALSLSPLSLLSFPLTSIDFENFHVSALEKWSSLCASFGLWKKILFSWL